MIKRVKQYKINKNKNHIIHLDNTDSRYGQNTDKGKQI